MKPFLSSELGECAPMHLLGTPFFSKFPFFFSGFVVELVILSYFVIFLFRDCGYTAWPEKPFGYTWGIFKAIVFWK